MAAITTAVVGTAVAVKGQRDAKKAQQAAAEGQQVALAQSAQLVGEAGRAAERDILEAQRAAAREIGAGTIEAQREIQPFTAAAGGYDLARQAMLEGQQLGGPLAESIRLASLGGTDERIFQGMGDPVQREIMRQAGVNVSAATPEIAGQQLAQGTQGIAALGDVAALRQRGFESLADIASGTGAARATLLTGNVPQLQQLASGAQEARILSDIAGQRARTGTIEELAKLAGRLT